MPKYTTVLLDADETIFDFKMSERLAILETCKVFGVSAADEDVSVYSEINASLWKELEKGALTRKELRLERFRRWFVYLSVSNVDIKAFDEYYATALGKAGVLFDDAEGFLEELSSFADIYIVTNGLTNTQNLRLNISGIGKYIKKMYVSETVGYAKPAVEFFEYVFSDLKITDKSKVIIMGDSLTSDMQGGKNAGIATCHYVRHGEKVQNSLCDYVVKNYKEFLDIIR
ncbi:MAG: YjjG family noncanonical pyrimidine nucleotidase [Eubacteriales bacterium]|nr:YjjG family noncanonical pyrimidine nucleotidase [Eubacteriales bacterium]